MPDDSLCSERTNYSPLDVNNLTDRDQIPLTPIPHESQRSLNIYDKKRTNRGNNFNPPPMKKRNNKDQAFNTTNEIPTHHHNYSTPPNSPNNHIPTTTQTNKRKRRTPPQSLPNIGTSGLSLNKTDCTPTKVRHEIRNCLARETIWTKHPINTPIPTPLRLNLTSSQHPECSAADTFITNYQYLPSHSHDRPATPTLPVDEPIIPPNNPCIKGHSLRSTPSTPSSFRRYQPTSSQFHYMHKPNPKSHNILRNTHKTTKYLQETITSS